jgi:hypothetical protein
LLNLPASSLRIYPRETVVAEKFQAMLHLGIKNSRVKDFYDIWFLSNHFEFQGNLLSQALKATFERRQTALPTAIPLALSEEFADTPDKQNQWKSFIRRSNLKLEPQTLLEIVIRLRSFLMPPCLAAANSQAFNQRWLLSGSWQASE